MLVVCMLGCFVDWIVVIYYYYDYSGGLFGIIDVEVWMYEVVLVYCFDFYVDYFVFFMVYVNLGGLGVEVIYFGLVYIDGDFIVIVCDEKIIFVGDFVEIVGEL